MQLHRLAAAALLGCLAATSQAQSPQAPSPASPAAQPAPPPLAQATPADPSGLPSPSAAEKVEKAPDNPTESETRNAEMVYEVLLGEISANTGDPGSAFSLLLDSARKSDDERLYRRAAEVALQARAGDSALQAARAWKAAVPASREANRYVLQILLALNRVGETADPLATELSLSGPTSRALTYSAIPALYARVSDKKTALEVVEKAAAADLEHPASPADGAAAWTAVGRMRVAAGDTVGALEAARRAQDLDATYEGPAIIALDLMDPKQPLAEPIVRRYLDSGAKVLPELRLAYARGLMEAQRSAEATRELQALTTEQPAFAEGWLLRGSQEAQDGQYPAAEQSIKTFLDLGAGNAGNPGSPGESGGSPLPTRGRDQAYLVMAQIAEKRGDSHAAEEWLKRIQSPQSLVAAQMRRASLLAGQGKLAEARKLVQQIPERNPDDARMKLMAEVQLLREHDRAAEAYNLLAQGHQRLPDDTDLTYDLAMGAEKIGKFDEMERLLRELIAKKPDYHHAYNALGYSLAERGVRLPEARDLINKALEFAPNDPFIRDSLGWVEFRMGNSDEAIRILDAAYKSRPDAEIAAHLGEVLWAAGQRDRAMAVWKEGQTLNSDSDTLKQTLKRLRVQL
ncbi:MAG: tetratricopeptide repeat protein [Pseudomonadota bacterium]